MEGAGCNPSRASSYPVRGLTLFIAQSNWGCRLIFFLKRRAKLNFFQEQLVHRALPLLESGLLKTECQEEKALQLSQGFAGSPESPSPQDTDLPQWRRARWPSQVAGGTRL